MLGGDGTQPWSAQKKTQRKENDSSLILKSDAHASHYQGRPAEPKL